MRLRLKRMGKNGAGDTFQCGHSNEQRLCNQNDRAGCGNAGIEWHKYSKSNTGGAGIQKMNTDWLVIQDNSTPDGSLTAAGGDYTAGIGGS